MSLGLLESGLIRNTKSNAAKALLGREGEADGDAKVEI